MDDFTVAPISKEQVEVAISPKPVEGDSLSIDYKGYEFKHGDIIGMDSEDPRLDLIEGGYDLNGEETVDISKLTPGFYFLLLENDEQRATVKFQVK